MDKPSIVVMKPDVFLGGQAVVEGVMMRGPRSWAVAVRAPDGSITGEVRAIESATLRHRVLRVPLVRGLAAVAESMVVGLRALSLSAQFAAPDQAPQLIPGDSAPTGPSRVALAGSLAISIGFVVTVFFVAPVLIAEALPLASGTAVVAVEAGIRVALFIGYLALLGLFPLLRRILQYHGAEHKVINAYEADAELTPEVARRYPLIHPRCGTAFLFWVVLLSAVIYAPFGRLPWQTAILVRIVLLPLVLAVCYELIRLAGTHATNRTLMRLLAPGLWLQRLTTREPTLDQLEVSIRALRAVLDREGTLAPARRRIEMIA